jgi:hypothetical protein
MTIQPNPDDEDGRSSDYICRTARVKSGGFSGARRRLALSGRRLAVKGSLKFHRLAKRDSFGHGGVEDEIVIRSKQPERIHLDPQEQLVAPAVEGRGERRGFTGVEIVNQIEKTDDIKVRDATVHGLLNRIDHVRSGAPLRIDAQIQAAGVDVAGEQPAQLDLKGSDAAKRIPCGGVDDGRRLAD